MNQPALGKKIADLRKAKGLTQEELVGKCNLNVRTLQRIESGEVIPRSYTKKTIFKALDYPYDSSEPSLQRTEFTVSHWLEQLRRCFLDLFNLETNKMTKISILSVLLFAIIFGLFSLFSESKAQTATRVQKAISASNANLIRWFNNGQIDSLLTLYRTDACLLSNGCGKGNIKGYYASQLNNYKFEERSTISLSIGDSVATEKGYWLVKLSSNQVLEGEYLTEWRLTNNEWLIVNDFAVNAQDIKNYLRDTKRIVKEGKYEEALKRYIWFHENALKHDKSMAGVRLSFALSDWKSLGQVYPPAMKELKETRDKTTNIILKDGGSPQLFSEVAAINRTIGENSKTLELFEEMLSKYPHVAKSSWYYAKDDLFEAKRYDIIKQFIGNPLREYSRLVSNYTRDTTMAKTLPNGSAFFKTYAENSFVKKAVQLIRFAAETGDFKAAKEVQESAIKVVKDYRLQEAIPKDKSK